MRPAAKNWILVGLLVVVGFECGILFERFTADSAAEFVVGEPQRDGRRRPAFQGDTSTDRFVLRLGSILDLTSDQTQEIELVVRQSHARIDVILSALRPEIASEVDSLNVEIRSLLTPDQRTAFDALLEEDNARFRSRMESGLVGRGVLN